MACLDTIDCGADRAASELVFLHGLLIELTGGVEFLPEIACTLGFSDVYRSPAFGTGDFIRLEKAPEDLLELLATLRVLATERVEELIEVANHGPTPPIH